MPPKYSQLESAKSMGNSQMLNPSFHFTLMRLQNWIRKLFYISCFLPPLPFLITTLWRMISQDRNRKTGGHSFFCLPLCVYCLGLSAMVFFLNLPSRKQEKNWRWKGVVEERTHCNASIMEKYTPLDITLVMTPLSVLHSHLYQRKTTQIKYIPCTEFLLTYLACLSSIVLEF